MNLAEGELRPAVTAVMSRRLERLSYLAADPRLPHGDVLHLVSDLTHDHPSLHVVLLTEKQTGRFISFSRKKFTGFWLSVSGLTASTATPGSEGRSGF